MKADFLLELLSEEIPARMQARAEADLARLLSEQLDAAGLTAEAMESWSTPRRLTLVARGLPIETAATSEERKGPRADAPAQAIEGFLKSTGLSRGDLVEREDKKGGRILFAVIEKPGRSTADVLAEAVAAVIRTFPWPKSMRWGEASASTESPRWVRPLQGIVALFGESIVEVEVAGVRSGAATVGHRFHHPGVITIGSANDYAEKLRACHVIVDPAERRRIIAEGADEAASAQGLAIVRDDGLLHENAGLTEWPVPLIGRFDPAFLDVPREVIQLTMRTNQKYFACVDGGGQLAPNFVCTANIEASDGGAAIVAGNEKVLAARLSDAKFFWEQDLKTPLEDQEKKLGEIVFHEKLGTIADKVERVAKLARWLVEAGIMKPSPLQGRGLGEGESETGSTSGNIAPGLPLSPTLSPEGERGQLANQAETAARLAKADLVTGMVGEFPELQGVIGGYLARAQGQPDAVADAIRDHYKPVGQGDEVPTAPVTVAVSLADKLDSLLSFFAIGEKPTGSKDPFALRRSALAIISLIVENGLRLPLTSAFTPWFSDHAARKVAEQGEPQVAFASLLRARLGEEAGGAAFRHYLDSQGQPLTAVAVQQIERIHAVENDLLGFFADRLKVQQREAGVRHDLIDAVFALGGEDDLVRLLARVNALQAFVETEEGADLLAGYKRAANILKKESWTSAPDMAAYAPEEEERRLVAALDEAEPRADAAIEAEDFAAAMAALASLRGPVDAFFDKVTVNDPDPARRAARLDLLARMRDAVHRVADFSRIEG